MGTARKILAWGVVFCVFMVQSLVAATPYSPMSIRQQADQLGPGAKVKLKLANGERVTGAIEAIQDTGLLVAAARESAAKLIGYDQIAQLRLASRRYSAAGDVDVLQVKRVVAALGVGQHIVVNRAGTKAIHGFIQAFDGDRFTVLPDHQVAPVQISYGEVRHIEKNLSLGATIVLVVLILAAVVVGAAVAATR